MKYRVTHSTRYDYAQPVSLSHNIVRLHPRNHGPQTCVEHRLTIVPSPATRSDQLDYFGNYCDYFCVQQSHSQLTIAAQSEVEVIACPWADLSHGPAWEQVRDDLAQTSTDDVVFAREFTFDSPHAVRSAELADYARASFTEGRPILEATMDLTKRIHADFKFVPGSTSVNTPVLEVLNIRKGVCQDFTHLQISCLRSLGLASRYVSGYLVTTPPPGQKRLTGADWSHAWVSVFSTAAGWVDFDPTNGVMPSEGHITIAWGRDYSDVGPIRGIVVGGRSHLLHVSVDVVPQEPAS